MSQAPAVTLSFDRQGRVRVSVADGDFEAAKDEIARLKAALGDLPVTFEGQIEQHRHDDLKLLNTHHAH